MKYIAIYLAVINITTILVTIMDKLRARAGSWRFSERSLIILGLLGGAISEYTTMKIIRHKTRHNKFMIGLPVIIFLQLAIVILYILKVAQIF